MSAFSGRGYHIDEQNNRIATPKRYLTWPPYQHHGQLFDTYDKETGKMRAVGKITTQPLTDAKLIELYCEFNERQSLNHPTLEPVYDFYIDSHQHGLMYITDQTSYTAPCLRTRKQFETLAVPKNNFPCQPKWLLPQIQSVARQLVNLLNYLHEQRQPIVHDNLFPDRIILLSDEPRVSTRLNPPMCQEPIYRTITKEWMDKNPPVFTAPERWSQTREYDCGVDVWNLGMCLMEMIFGFPQLEIMDYQSIAQLVHLVSFKALECFLECCLCQNRFERATASELGRHNFIKNDAPSLERLVQTEDECFEDEYLRIRQYEVVLRWFARKAGLPVGGMMDVLNLVQRKLTHIPFSEPAYDVSLKSVFHSEHEFSIELNFDPRPQLGVAGGREAKLKLVIRFKMKDEEKIGDIITELVNVLKLHERDREPIEEALSWDKLEGCGCKILHFG